MSTIPQRGMDHDLYPFSPLPQRPRLVWPGGARLALWVVLYLEHWEIASPDGEHRAPGVQGPWGNFTPDFRTYSYRDYGNRIGIFRVLDVLDRFGIRATVAADAGACARHPHLVRACVDRGWEIAAHGLATPRMITERMDEETERSAIAHSIAAVTEAAGRRPDGWFGPEAGESTRTPRLAAEAGLRYIADWPNDEQPYAMTGAPPLVSMPLQPEFDDQQQLWMRQLPAWKWPDLVETAADRLLRDGETSARLLCLTVRPWLLGRPHRIGHLADALERIRGRAGVWQATAGQIVDSFLEQQGAR